MEYGKPTGGPSNSASELCHQGRYFPGLKVLENIYEADKKTRTEEGKRADTTATANSSRFCCYRDITSLGKNIHSEGTTSRKKK